MAKELLKDVSIRTAKPKENLITHKPQLSNFLII